MASKIENFRAFISTMDQADRHKLAGHHRGDFMKNAWKAFYSLKLSPGHLRRKSPKKSKKSKKSKSKSPKKSKRAHCFEDLCTELKGTCVKGVCKSLSPKRRVRYARAVRAHRGSGSPKRKSTKRKSPRRSGSPKRRGPGRPPGSKNKKKSCSK